VKEDENEKRNKIKSILVELDLAHEDNRKIFSNITSNLRKLERKAS